MSFSTRIVERRVQLKISQKELAKRIGVTPTRLNYWEKGKREPNMYYISAIAQALDISCDYLLEKSEFGEPESYKHKQMNTGFINERKRALNLTNQKIAEQTGITLSTLDKITSGVNTNPKLDTMKALARVLKCSIDDFTDESRQSLDNDEISLIFRYRAMDERSKKFVRMVIDYELGRAHPEDAPTLQTARDVLGDKP